MLANNDVLYVDYYRNLSDMRHENKETMTMWFTPIDIFTDSDAILNFSPVNFCVKWTLYFVSTLNIMEEFQFLRSFDLRKLCNMSVEVCVFMKALVWPWRNSHIPCGEWEFYNIGQNPS